MSLYKIGVVGGGTMGREIANLIAQEAGIPVVILEQNPDLAQKALGEIFHKNDRAVDRGKLMPDKAEAVKTLVTASDDLQSLREVDLVIEAVFEDIRVKREVFHLLDSFLPESTIFASNTSSLSIGEMANFTRRPEKFIGMHFFNPALTMPLVEVIWGKRTEEEVIAVIEDLCRSLGKTSIRVKDCPGFLVNRLLMPYLNEAVWLLTETNLKPEEIDQEATKFGWPMGPFRLLDYLGIDIVQRVANILYEGFGERAKPAPLLGMLEEAGRLGRKAGAGFYVYDDSGKKYDSLEKIINKGSFGWAEPLAVEDGFRRMMSSMVNEAILCLEECVTTAEDIEIGVCLGIGFPSDRKGILHFGYDVGWLTLLSQLRELQKVDGPRFKPAKLLEECATAHKKIFE